LPQALAGMAAAAATHRAAREEPLVHLATSAAALSTQATASADGCGSPRDGVGSAPLHEVPLSHLHKRSSPLRLTCTDLAQGLDSARRLDALEWLVQAFDALNLSDAQLYSAFGLLDRFAAASPVPISAGPGAFAFVLAAMLVALKVSGTQRDLERAKRLVIEASGTPRPWAAVRKAELQILRRLGFRACTPTCLDFLDRLLMEAVQTASATASVDSLDAEARAKVGDLARLLLELGLVHEPEAVYGSSGHPPLASALAALLLALVAFRAPPSCAEALREPLNLLESDVGSVGVLAEAMRTRWQSEERKSAMASGSSQGGAVLEKWKRRMGSIGASVPSSLDMRHIVPEGLKAIVEDSELSAPGRRLRGKQAVSPLRQREASIQPGTILAAPTAVSRMSIGGEQAPLSSSKTSSTHVRREVLEASSLAGSGSMELAASAASTAPASARPASTLTEAPGHRGSSALGTGSAHGPAAAAGRYPSSQLATALSRVTVSENLSAWPPASGLHSQEQLLSPHHAASKAAQASTRGSALAPANIGNNSPEPLVELTHVLNMVHPTGVRALSNLPTNGTVLQTSKPKPPTVASELLVSSALRLAWPPDRRKGVDIGVAAGSCRDAASMLEEAAQYLRITAANLDSGVVQARELKATALSGAGSESKRRRTFGGPSPQRASSPTGGVVPQPLARGSPPVCRGIRV